MANFFRQIFYRIKKTHYIVPWWYLVSTSVGFLHIKHIFGVQKLFPFSGHSQSMHIRIQLKTELKWFYCFQPGGSSGIQEMVWHISAEKFLEKNIVPKITDKNLLFNGHPG
jgi:hypothetical protein